VIDCGIKEKLDEASGAVFDLDMKLNVLRHDHDEKQDYRSCMNSVLEALEAQQAALELMAGLNK